MKNQNQKEREKLENLLERNTQKIFDQDKGILAADESENTAGKRLADIGMENREENRRRYRELFIKAKGAEKYISGIILHTETLFQKDSNGKLFVDTLKEKDILVGIKVDQSLASLPNSAEEHFTQGLDGLDARFQEYKKQGAIFSKWRSVFKIDKNEKLPSRNAVRIAANIFALYAGIAQRNGIVPIIEPEILMKGNYTTKEKATTMKHLLDDLFLILRKFEIYLPGLILKIPFMHPGSLSGEYLDDEKISAINREIIVEYIPSPVGGVVFLSGGLSRDTAFRFLSGLRAALPKHLSQKATFSFARALQKEPLEIFSGKDENIEKAREKFLEILKSNFTS